MYPGSGSQAINPSPWRKTASNSPGFNRENGKVEESGFPDRSLRSGERREDSGIVWPAQILMVGMVQHEQEADFFGSDLVGTLG